LDDIQLQPVRQLVVMHRGEVKRRRRRNVGALRAVDVLPLERGGGAERGYRNHQYEFSHGVVFRCTELGGVTFSYGRFGLLTRSSLPAGTMLITTRPGVR